MCVVWLTHCGITKRISWVKSNLGMLETTIPNQLNENHAYKDIYEQFVNEASFLWILRSIAINEPHNDINDIIALENRIVAQLDGLMTSLEIGWEVCEEALELSEPGEVFTATIIAMRSHESSKVKLAVDVGLSSSSTMRGLISAMGWLSDDIADLWIERFLNGKDLKHKYIGIAACSVRRTDPGNALLSIFKREDCIQDINLYSRAIRLVGELRRQDCMPFISKEINSDDKLIRFWANWSAVLLGQHSSIENLKSYVLTNNVLQDLAIQLAFRVLAIDSAREWISELSKDESQIRAVIKAIGVLGDPHAVNWLINKMSDPLYAKLAAESFSYITGVDFDNNKLSITEPENYPTIPNDDMYDDIVGLDEDENLAFPDADKVTSIWQKYGQKFIVGKRYFMGQLITSELLKERLQNGTQRQRHAAALELAINENGIPLINTRAKVSTI